ncbi:MAG: alpha,alpha-trehalase TreF [Bacteroidota bacterium]
MNQQPKEIFELGELFEKVQLNAILEDGKTFVDCIPKFPLEEIQQKYELAKQNPSFDLKIFVIENFSMPPQFGSDYKSDLTLPVAENIRNLWPMLTRDTSAEVSSLINLPNRYIVPGGRFREIYYWDSYFTMLGLKEDNRVDLIEDMVSNFAYLINKIGHIPNGNRQYYISRSQPPFFALMVQLLAETKKDESVYKKYQKELEKEYAFWMDGATDLKKGDIIKRVACMPDGTLLNRYYDASPKPREESFAEDVHISKNCDQTSETVFTNLRAGAESGWDFSTRWFADSESIGTIETTQIIPVDLNCLIYILEQTIAKAATLSGDVQKASEFIELSANRRMAILEYCWNNKIHYFCDYHFVKKQTLDKQTAAGLYPLFVSISNQHQANAVAHFVEAHLLKPGGLVTTNIHSGQQWDAPNGWAPLQWIAFEGLKKYGLHHLANEIGSRWIKINEKVFEATGKLMEKYNVEDLSKLAGGGEYEGQDGFGWTNGVYLALKKALKENN